MTRAELLKFRAKIKAGLEAKREERKAHRIAGERNAPRYDEVYAEGMAYMDAVARGDVDD
jgi:hypothetical protein